MFLVLMKILNKHQGKMFYNLKLMQTVVNIVIRDNPDDLAQTFVKGIHLSVNNRRLFIAAYNMLLIR